MPMDEIRMINTSNVRHSQVDQPGFPYIGCNELARRLNGRQKERQITGCSRSKTNLLPEDMPIDRAVSQCTCEDQAIMYRVSVMISVLGCSSAIAK